MLKKLPVFLVVVFAGFAVIAILNQLFFADRAVISLSQPSGEKAVAPIVGSGEPGPSAAMSIPESNVKEAVVNSVAATIITYTDSGFSPASITIKKGETVTFKNKSSRSFWPASAMHPTHTVYPGSDIKKCGTSDEPNIFDACHGIEQGAEWSFRFNNVGTWNYHDHLNASKYGSIVVQ